MKRSLNEIKAVSTSHDVGLKRVLLAANESGCSLTQIAVTDLKVGEVAQAHIHPDMQEGFYVLEGDLDVKLDDEVLHCSKDDFVYVKSLTSHELRAVTDVRIMTIGCVIESQRSKLYPLLFEPNLHEIVWGGNKLTAWKGLAAKDHIGESWEVSCVESSPSVIANGTWTGYTLKEVIKKHPEAILGREVSKRYSGELPLLVKFIDARKDLSIQVHPDDEMAKRLHDKNGKSEMWYVLDAEPGAYLYSGFKEELSAEDYKRKVADGTIVESLAKHEVKAGDVFYLPAGRVHAICSGILLAEVQQSSDVTYRIYDYNRPGLDGKPRELHTELAAEALNYQVEKEYRTEYSNENNHANSVIESPFFSVRVTEFSDTFHRNLIKYDSFVISMCLKGDCKIKIRSTGDEVVLREGYSCLIPAAIADYDITPLKGNSKVLDAYIDNMDRSLLNKVSRFLHISTK
jgi:mannose-6-phosphate isomerase